MIKFRFNLKKNKVKAIEPTKIIVFSFIAVIFWGTLLLALPISSANPEKSTDFLTALFTATSATCVTGFLVVDTLTGWSVFGQIVILSLVQIGALGFVTFATFFSILFGRKVGLKTMILAQESLNQMSFEGILRLIKRVVMVTFLIELIGAILLSISFVPKFGPRGFYLAVFHSISAFCNSGFDIFGNYQSLTEYNNNPLVMYTMAGLIIIGGLGFVVWKDIWEFRKNRELLLHTKVVLLTTAFLIISGTVLFYCFEYNNPGTMGDMNTFTKINASFIHSVMTRTAGFNSIPLNNMREISKIVSVIFMFIGAAPGSTGGGIKLTTFGVILAVIISQTKGSNDTIVFKKRIPHSTVDKALAIIGLSLMLLLIVTTIILVIENRPFVDVLLESASAFSTAGMSSIGTANLQTASKIVLLITMFLGRVGPLTFAIALSLKNNKKTQDLVYPEGKIVVG